MKFPGQRESGKIVFQVRRGPIPGQALLISEQLLRLSSFVVADLLLLFASYYTVDICMFYFSKVLVRSPDPIFGRQNAVLRSLVCET